MNDIRKNFKKLSKVANLNNRLKGTSSLFYKNLLDGFPQVALRPQARNMHMCDS
jgi:hypothetical protein